MMVITETNSIMLTHLINLNRQRVSRYSTIFHCRYCSPLPSHPHNEVIDGRWRLASQRNEHHRIRSVDGELAGENIAAANI